MNPSGDNRDSQTHPLKSMDEWEEDLLQRASRTSALSSGSVSQQTDRFRNYAAEARPSVREFYRLNHQHQTVDFVRGKHAQYLTLSALPDGHLGGHGVSEPTGR